MTLFDAHMSPNLLAAEAEIAHRMLALRYGFQATPLLESPLLNQLADCRILVKAECLAPTGSFKIRGALHALTALADQHGGKPPKILAISTGNHAQAVAYAGQLLKADVKVLMPADAPQEKLANTRAYGAAVVTYQRQHDDREVIAAKIAADEGRTLIHPYNNLHVMAGQGTCGVELAQQCQALDITPEAVFIPTSGGGLAAGVGSVLRQHWAKTALNVVEPVGYDDTNRSLAARARVALAALPPTICDAITANTPGEVTFPYLQAAGYGGVVVDENATLAAMRLAHQYLHIALEPAAATGLAAAMQFAAAAKATGHKADPLVVVATGGNVSDRVFARAMGCTAG